MVGEVEMFSFATTLKNIFEKGPIAGWLGSSRLVSLCTCTQCATREVEPRNPSLNAFPAASRERIGDDLTPSRERVKSRRFKPRGVDALLKRSSAADSLTQKEELKMKFSKGIQRDCYILCITRYNVLDSCRSNWGYCITYCRSRDAIKFDANIEVKFLKRKRSGIEPAQHFKTTLPTVELTVFV